MENNNNKIKKITKIAALILLPTVLVLLYLLGVWIYKKYKPNKLKLEDIKITNEKEQNNKESNIKSDSINSLIKTQIEDKIEGKKEIEELETEKLDLELSNESNQKDN